MVDDIMILSTEYLILFKAKAWLDLSEKIKTNPNLGRRNVKKHMDDIVQLARMLSGNETPSMNEGVKTDIRQFIAILCEKITEMKTPDTGGVSVEQLIEILKKVYL